MSAISDGEFTDIMQSWTTASGQYMTVNRTYEVIGASDTAKPVLIYLHGKDIMDYTLPDDVASLVDDWIVVSPRGLDENGNEALGNNSWNVVDEPSDAPDVEFIGRIIDNMLVHDANVAPQIYIWGHSNGAALTFQVLIESDNTKLMGAVCTCSQLSVMQYDNGAFMSQSGDERIPLSTRRIAMIVGMLDDVVTNEFSTDDTTYTTPSGGEVLSLQDSALAWARALYDDSATQMAFETLPSNDRQVVYGSSVLARAISNGYHSVPIGRVRSAIAFVTDNSDDSSNDGNNTRWAVILICFMVLLFIALAVVIGVFYKTKNNRKMRNG